MYDLGFETDCWAPINKDSFDAYKTSVYCHQCRGHKAGISCDASATYGRVCPDGTAVPAGSLVERFDIEPFSDFSAT